MCKLLGVHTFFPYLSSSFSSATFVHDFSAASSQSPKRYITNMDPLLTFASGLPYPQSCSPRMIQPFKK
jgi:hypothetical protein